MADDYDSPWKEAIERHFADFLAFYFPDAHAQIDWSVAPVFLEQELRSVTHDAPPDPRIVDKLIRLTRRSGEPSWVYLHLEVQADRQAAFEKRMFTYHYRLFEKHQQPIASIAVLADDHDQWRPDCFGYQVLGCELTLRFPVAKLLDWAGSEARLEDSTNPFALVTLAHLATRATRNDMAARKAAKWHLVKHLRQRAWDRAMVVDLFRVIDWMLRLPSGLAQEFRQELNQLEEETMGKPYVTSIEELAKEEGLQLGMQQGIQQGVQQGVQQGRLEAEARTLVRLLSRRFGEIPFWARQKIQQAAEAELEAWLDTILTADSIEAVFGEVQM